VVVKTGVLERVTGASLARVCVEKERLKYRELRVVDATATETGETTRTFASHIPTNLAGTYVTAQQGAARRREAARRAGQRFVDRRWSLMR
jgi:hypothetical protein